MDFGLFLDAFGKGYRALHDKETGEALGKEWFCRDLLCAITKHEEYVTHVNGIIDIQHKRTQHAFYAYYRNGKQRRSLHPIAMFIVNSLDADKFKDFLEAYVQNYQTEKLLKRFLKYLPQATMGTLFDDITNELCDILISAANRTDNRQPSSIDEPSNNQDLPESDMTDNPNLLRNKLVRLLGELEKRVVELYSNYLKFTVDYETSTPEQREKIDKTIRKNHTAFRTLNDMLSDIIVYCPDFQQLNDLHHTGECWVLSFFRPWDEVSTLQMPDGMLEYYRKLLNETKDAVSEYFGQSDSDS